jgi:nucleoside-diphosphate-sugar epimerase
MRGCEANVSESRINHPGQAGQEIKDAPVALSNGRFIISPNDLVLVTGANGFIGTRVVEILLEKGFANLRCFVRPSSRLDRLMGVVRRFQAESRVDVVTGDLLAGADCQRAAGGASVIYHLAAGIEKTFAGAFMNSALTTRNLLEVFAEHRGPGRFVQVSSFAVYSNLKLKRGAVLDESCPLETSFQERNDAYGFGKLKQEELVREYGERSSVPYVILRPGAVFGPGKPSLSGRVGIDTFGFFIHLGGSNRLPLTYVDNCAEAIVLAGLTPGVDGEVFNVVDDDLPTSRQFLRNYRKVTKPFFSLRVPYFVAYGLSSLWENYSKRSQGQLPPVFNRRRCSAEWKGNRYSNRKLRERLGWSPHVNMREAMDRFLAQF